MRARELPALIFALIWLLGYEVVPFAHLAMHAQIGAHVHGASTHCHGDVCHGESVDGKPDDASDPVSHGAGSLEHRGVAALASDLRVFVPELMLVGELPLVPPHVARIETFEPTTPPARGPPV
jgi:hypothetical protein